MIDLARSGLQACLSPSPERSLRRVWIIPVGLWVGIRHRIPGVEAEGYESLYAHLSQVQVETGQWIKAGAVIGRSGNTGCSTGPHLHFEILRLTQTNSGQPTPVDPYGWRGSGTDPWADHPEGARSEVLWRPGQAPEINSCLKDQR